MEVNVTLVGRHCCAKCRCESFTLAELLVVIAIMALVIAVALPAFQGLGTGASLKASVTQLRVTLSLARQWAITHREQTCVVFVDGTLVQWRNLHKAYKAYAVFAITDDSVSPVQGYYVNDWTFLPSGVVFDPTNRPAENVFSLSTAIINNLPFMDATTVEDLNAVVFKPDGSARPQCEIFLREGWAIVNTNNTPWSLDFGMKPAGPPVGVEVSQLTGGLRVNDYAQ